MDRDATRIADLRAILASKRRLVEDHHLGRSSLPPWELRRLMGEIWDHEEALRDAGVDDA